MVYALWFAPCVFFSFGLREGSTCVINRFNKFVFFIIITIDETGGGGC